MQGTLGRARTSAGAAAGPDPKRELWCCVAQHSHIVSGDFSSLLVCRLAPGAVQNFQQNICLEPVISSHAACMTTTPAAWTLQLIPNNRCQCWKLRYKVVGRDTNWLHGILCSSLDARPSHSAHNQACG